MTYTSVSSLAQAAERDQALVETIKADPVKALRELASPWSDVLFYRVVAGGLVGIVFTTLVCFAAIVVWQPQLVDKTAFLQALGTTGIGALAGVLSQPKS